MSFFRTITDFLRRIFGVFFNWWWAVVTGVASILGFLGFPKEGFNIGPGTFGFLILIFFILVFLVASLIYNSWNMFVEGMPLRVVAYHRSRAYGGHFVFLLEGNLSIQIGSLIQLSRTENGVQYQMALLEIRERNSMGLIQAHPVWIAPAQQSQLSRVELNVDDIQVEMAVRFETVQGQREEIEWRRNI